MKVINLSYSGLTSLGGASAQAVNIQVVLLQDKVTLATSVIALTSDSSRILARSCSKTLNTGPFASIPISFDVDHNSAGNITVGSESFPIQGSVDRSGRIICSRVDSKVDSLASCRFGVSSPAIRESTALPAYNEGLAGCFSDSGLGVASFLRLPSVDAKPMIAARGPDDILSKSPVTKRQEECLLWSYYTQRAGSGDPHQAPFHIQLSVRYTLSLATSAVRRVDG